MATLIIVWLAAGGGIEKYKMGTSWTRFQSSLEEIKQNNCTLRAALGLYITTILSLRITLEFFRFWSLMLIK